MTYSEMIEAVREARETVRNGDSAVCAILEIARGRLRMCRVGGDILSALKRELRDWDMHKGEWKGGG